MIRVVAKFNLKPEEIEKAIPLFAELITTTRKEEGCESYDLAKATGDDNIFVILEAWESEEALNVHSASEHFTRLVPQLAAMCTSAPVVESLMQVI